MVTARKPPVKAANDTRAQSLITLYETTQAYVQGSRLGSDYDDYDDYDRRD